MRRLRTVPLDREGTLTGIFWSLPITPPMTILRMPGIWTHNLVVTSRTLLYPLSHGCLSHTSVWRPDRVFGVIVRWRCRPASSKFNVVHLIECSVNHRHQALIDVLTGLVPHHPDLLTRQRPFQWVWKSACPGIAYMSQFLKELPTVFRSTAFLFFANHNG
jgi:hypothetical protein